MTALLSTAKVTVSFRGLLALSDVSIELERGTITGLIGPNGAGKTTMIGVLSGLIRPRSGRVVLDGRDITRLSPHHRAHLGMARTFQRLELWQSMSVEENVQTAAEFASSWRQDWDVAAVTSEAIQMLGLDDVAHREVGELPSGQGRLVEVARAVAVRPRVLLLDEPSAGLTESESHQLGTTLSTFVRTTGTTILLVEHHVELVAAICSYIYVLDFGGLIESGPPDKVRASPVVQEAYLGKRLSAADLDLRHIDAAYGPVHVLFALSLPVAEGKVTAVLGPNGAGKTTTLNVAAGLLPPVAGTISLRGEDITGQAPRLIARRGLCLIPEGRGIFPSLTVRENLLLQSAISGKKRSDIEEVAFVRFPVLGNRRKQVAGTLSGGEQHMLALSRALTTDPEVILIDEISMGLAPILVEQLFETVVDLARQGRTIVVVEQLAELAMEIADFVAVMSKGRVLSIGQPDDVRDVLESAYLGGETRAQADRRVTDDGRKWRTPKGTLAHQSDCPIVATRTDALPVAAGADLGACAICAAAPTAASTPVVATNGPVIFEEGRTLKTEL